MLSDKISYILKKSKRAKKIRLSVYRNGSVVVTIPCGIKNDVAKKFVEEKSEWIFKKIEEFKILPKNNTSNLTTKDYKENKDKALVLISERASFFSKKLNLKYNKISIRNQKTRWGSCSRKGNLSFNYKILFLPKKITDYIVIHELCHLKEFNHSKRFWSLVANSMPDYHEIKTELKNYSLI